MRLRAFARIIPWGNVFRRTQNIFSQRTQRKEFSQSTQRGHNFIKPLSKPGEGLEERSKIFISLAHLWNQKKISSREK